MKEATIALAILTLVISGKSAYNKRKECDTTKESKCTHYADINEEHVLLQMHYANFDKRHLKCAYGI